MLQSVHQTDSAHPTEMAADSGTLKLPPFPDQFPRWPEWETQVLAVLQNTNLRVKNADQNWEDCSYLSMGLFGFRWKHDVEIWLGEDQDIDDLDTQAIQQHSNLSADEIAFLLEDEDLFHWNHARTHRRMQITLRHAAIAAMQDSPFYNELHAFAKTISPTNLHQRARALAHMHEFS